MRNDHAEMGEDAGGAAHAGIYFKASERSDHSFGSGQGSRLFPWYAARIFKEVTGKAPFEYIRVLRLSGQPSDYMMRM